MRESLRAAFGGQVGRMLHEQRRGALESHVAAARAAQGAWGALRGGATSGGARAAATFGLPGPCACEAACCPGGPRVAELVAAGDGPPQSPTGSGLVSRLDPPAMAPTGSVETAPEETIVDAHSHHFGTTASEWHQTQRAYRRGTTPNTELAARIESLVTLRDYGVLRLWLSSFLDPAFKDEKTSPYSGELPTLYPTTDPPLDGEELDEVTAWAVDLYPDFFRAFARGFALEDPGAPAYVEGCLAAGFDGIGELIVHGHGYDFDEVDALVEILWPAVRAGALALVHWDIGMVDRPDVRSAEENFQQLVEVLRGIEKRMARNTQRVGQGRGHGKVILAHCGAGPMARNMQPSSPELADYAARLDDLLADFPWVLFDIAGTVNRIEEFWVGGSPSPVGAEVLDRMAEAPQRFLVGLDAENKSVEDINWYGEGVKAYLDYLAYEELIRPEYQALIATGNGLALLP